MTGPCSVIDGLLGSVTCHVAGLKVNRNAFLGEQTEDVSRHVFERFMIREGLLYYLFYLLERDRRCNQTSCYI